MLLVSIVHDDAFESSVDAETQICHESMHSYDRFSLQVILSTFGQVTRPLIVPDDVVAKVQCDPVGKQDIGDSDVGFTMRVGLGLRRILV